MSGKLREKLLSAALATCLGLVVCTYVGAYLMSTKIVYNDSGRACRVIDHTWKYNAFRPLLVLEKRCLGIEPGFQQNQRIVYLTPMEGG